MRFPKIAPVLLALCFSVCLIAGCSSENEPIEDETSLENEDTVQTEIQSADSDEDDPGASLDAWALDGGWVGLYVFALDDSYDLAWETAASTMAENSGMDFEMDDLKSQVLDDKGLKENIESLSFEGDTITGYSETGKTIFSHEYSYISKISEAIDEYDAYVYATSDDDAGEYTYLCMTLPDEEDLIAHFYWRSGLEDYESLFSSTYEGATGAMVDSSEFAGTAELAILELYGAIDENEANEQAIADTGTDSDDAD